MTGPEHHREAERLLAEALPAGHYYEEVPTLLAAAVHALLANSRYSDDDPGPGSPVRRNISQGRDRAP